MRTHLSYDGTDFNGWQTQPGYRTVQETLESAIAALTGEPRIKANASGRTDAGVHAVGQVANFHTVSPYSPDVFVTRRSTPGCRPTWSSVMPERSRSRSTPTGRDAKAVPLCHPRRAGAEPISAPVLLATSNVGSTTRRCAGGRCSLGRHDFHSFETEWPNRQSSVRTITHLGGEPSRASGSGSTWKQTVSCTIWCGPSPAR